jgi:cytochrome c biogenesis protein CcmG/thiol:disulfide interchange protein DsbE
VADDDAVPAPRRRIAPLIALLVASVLTLLFVVLAQARGGEAPESAETPLLGRVAPAARGELLTGGSFDLARRKGSWVVLNFFQSACVPCREEHPELVRFAQQQRGLGLDGAELYTIVSSDDSRDAVQSFFADNGGDWPIVMDPRGEIGVEFQVNKVPETWIVSPEGLIVWRTISQISADGLSAELQRLREARDAALPSSPS